MIGAPVDIGVLYGYDLTYALYDTDQRVVAHGIAAYIAGIMVRDIIAIIAKFDLAAHTGHDLTEMVDFAPVLPEQVQDQAERRFLPYTGQLLELSHGISY